METLEAVNETLRKRVAELERTISTAATAVHEDDTNNREEVSRNSLGKAGMTAAEIKRYSRHLLVPAVGVAGQRQEWRHDLHFFFYRRVFLLSVD